jgi:hypothetical protein
VALLERARDALTPDANAVPKDVEERIKRGEKRLDHLKPKRRQNVLFANGHHYSQLSEDGAKLTKQGLVPLSAGGEKPDHRVRQSRDLIGPIVQGKVAAATNRVPGYEVTPSSTDSEDWSASKIAEKISYAGYENWHIRTATQKLVWNACVTEEGFVMAYWDNQIGPFYELDDDNGGKKVVGEGDVRVGVWNGQQVMWEPGVEFEKSPWWAILHKKPKDVVEADPDYLGGKLKADADQDDGKASDNLVLITEYIERPCAKWPEGRRLFFASKRQIFREETYPLQDKDGHAIDEPPLHRLTYTVDGSSERGKGLVNQLIDSMRAYDQAGNKQIEWMQIMLVPQFTAPVGSMKTERSDEPGAINEFDPALAQGMEPKPVEVQQPPQALDGIMNRAQNELSVISANNEIPTQLRSASGVQAIYEQNAMQWSDFLMNLAEVHSRLMRDCLTLVQRYYTDTRLLQFRGRHGYLPISDFRGADLRGQTDVRVNAGSLESKTRASIKQEIMNIAQMFPGYFPPEIILSALNNGNAEGLIEGYEEDVARANYVITLIRSGNFWNEPMRQVWPGEEAGTMLNPETGGPMMMPSGREEPILEPTGMPNPETGEPEMTVTGAKPVMVPVPENEVPGWMPRPFDSVSVHKAVMESWFKTDEWNTLDQEAKQASMTYYAQLLKMEETEAVRKSKLQSELAEGQGLANAAKPQGTKPMPSQPALEQQGPAAGQAETAPAP